MSFEQELDKVFDSYHSIHNLIWIAIKTDNFKLFKRLIKSIDLDYSLLHDFYPRKCNIDEFRELFLFYSPEYEHSEISLISLLLDMKKYKYVDLIMERLMIKCDMKEFMSGISWIMYKTSESKNMIMLNKLDFIPKDFNHWIPKVMFIFYASWLDLNLSEVIEFFSSQFTNFDINNNHDKDFHKDMIIRHEFYMDINRDDYGVDYDSFYLNPDLTYNIVSYRNFETIDLYLALKPRTMYTTKKYFQVIDENPVLSDEEKAKIKETLKNL